ncbi:MAG: hypothetical protein TECD_00332 [Hyphomicrobiaceae bacterium hypho_1]
MNKLKIFKFREGAPSEQEGQILEDYMLDLF